MENLSEKIIDKILGDKKSKDLLVEDRVKIGKIKYLGNIHNVTYSPKRDTYYDSDSNYTIPKENIPKKLRR